MNSKSISLLALNLLLTIQEAQGHAVWQQIVLEDGTPKSVYTFSEKPGLKNVGEERFSQMVYDKGVTAHIQSDSTSSSLEVYLDGPYLKADIPQEDIYANVENKEEEETFALESVIPWGVFSEHGPAALIFFYTSASNVQNDLDKTVELSTNEFVFLLDASSDKHEVDAYVHFQEDALDDHTVSFYDGDSGELLEEVQTDENGKASVQVHDSVKSVFARVKHTIDESGTLDGEDYLTISNIATSFVQFGSLEEQSKASSSSESSSSTTKSYASTSASASASTENSEEPVSTSYSSSVVSVTLASFVGSFLASFLFAHLQSRRRSRVAIVEPVHSAII